mmetsp:Transcript_82652/g.130747  ORF Transcript_82652/g.130747 Transcript_82652/m.130747 type:complete len:127 (+) Transcript_82652:1183-1563(+)
MPNRKLTGPEGGNRGPCARSLAGRSQGSAPDALAATSMMRWASETVKEKIDTQSSDLQAGSSPCVDKRPRDALRPTILFKAAGTRPLPAVSVPKEKLTCPKATATPEPEEEPPDKNSRSNEFWQAP